MLAAADALLRGSGERAFDVAEQLGFEQRLGKTGDVHGDHRELAARARHVQGACDYFFAGAGFPADQHGRAAPRDQADDIRCSPNRGTRPDQHLAPGFSDSFGGPAPAGFRGRLDLGDGIIVRTCDVVRAELHVAYGIGQVGATIANHYGHGSAQGEEPVQKVLDRQAGYRKGHDRHIVVDVGQAVDPLRSRWGAIDQPVWWQIDAIRSDVEGSKRLGFQICASEHLSEAIESNVCF